MKDKVIQAAGRSWKILGEKGPISVAQLAKALKVTTDVASQAVGWLAREDKIKYIEKGRSYEVSLVDTEQHMFKILSETPLATSKKS